METLIENSPAPSVEVPRLVLPSQLRFPVDPMWPERSNWFDRWIARKTAARILNGKSSSYQFGGPIGAKYPKSYVLVDARKEQLAQCILRAVGYACCTADIMAITGYDPEFRQNGMDEGRRTQDSADTTDDL